MSEPYIPSELRELAQKVAQGERPRVMVRNLLRWFFASYRTRSKVREIETALATLGLETEPHFDWTYLDGLVTVQPSREGGAKGTGSATPVELQVSREDSLHQSDSVAVSTVIYVDSTHRIGRLAVANRPPVSIVPDATIKQAVTLMLKDDFSQLPVMTSEREVKGLFGWKSLGSRVSQGQVCNVVRDAMDEHCEVSADASLFRAIALIQEHDCILVRDAAKKITGIMTPYDISVTFGQLAEPFLVLSEIENHIRNLIRGKFTVDELASARDPGDPNRKVNDVEDLTFGEYMRLLESPERWAKLRLQIDRNIFIKDVDEVRRIRNDVMHFDPEGTDESDIAKLRKFAAFLQRLEKLRPR
jgi:predicted transcriptional regulator